MRKEYYKIKMKRNLIVFNCWIGSHYEDLKSGLCRYEGDLDALHDCIVSIYDDLCKRDDMPYCTRSVFLSYYRASRRKRVTYDFPYVRPGELFFRLLADSPQPSGQDLCDPADLLNTIIAYAKKESDKKHYALIKMYLKGCQVRDISAYTGVSVRQVRKIINEANLKIHTREQLVRMYNLINETDYETDRLRQ